MPLYVREHAKRILRGSLYNDTKFLSDVNVMDYSLVVGVDSVSNEMVVGIVGTLCMNCFCFRFVSPLSYRLYSYVHLG